MKETEKPKRRWARKLLIGLISAVVFPLIIGIFLVLALDLRMSDQDVSEYFEKNGIKGKIEYHNNIRTILTSSLYEKSKLTILFIHGAPGSGDQFKTYLTDSTLRSIANLASIDRPGYGYSNYGEAKVSIIKQAESIQSYILNATKDSTHQYILVTHSYGGPIGAYLTYSLPSLIKFHLMLNPVVDPEHEKEFWFSALPLWWPFKFISSGSMKVAAYEKLSHAAELSKIAHIWPDIRVPTIHIQGEKDWLAPVENARFIKTHADSSYIKVKMLKDESHFLPFTDKEFIIHQIIDNNIL